MTWNSYVFFPVIILLLKIFCLKSPRPVAITWLMNRPERRHSFAGFSHISKKNHDRVKLLRAASSKGWYKVRRRNSRRSSNLKYAIPKDTQVRSFRTMSVAIPVLCYNKKVRPTIQCIYTSEGASDEELRSHIAIARKYHEEEDHTVKKQLFKTFASISSHLAVKQSFGDYGGVVFVKVLPNRFLAVQQINGRTAWEWAWQEKLCFREKQIKYKHLKEEAKLQSLIYGLKILNIHESMAVVITNVLLTGVDHCDYHGNNFMITSADHFHDLRIKLIEEEENIERGWGRIEIKSRSLFGKDDSASALIFPSQFKLIDTTFANAPLENEKTCLTKIAPHTKFGFVNDLLPKKGGVVKVPMEKLSEWPHLRILNGIHNLIGSYPQNHMRLTEAIELFKDTLNRLNEIREIEKKRHCVGRGG